MEHVLLDIFSLPIFNDCQRVLKLTCKDLAEKQTVKQILDLSLTESYRQFINILPKNFTWSITGLFSAGKQHRCIKMKKFFIAGGFSVIRMYQLNVIYQENKWCLQYATDVQTLADRYENRKKFESLSETTYKFFTGDMADFAILDRKTSEKILKYHDQDISLYEKQEKAFRSLLYRDTDILFRYFTDLVYKDSLDDMKNILMNQKKSFNTEDELNEYMIQLGKKI